MLERGRGGAGLSAVAPGLPQLLAGRWVVGLVTLVPWLGAIGLLVLRAAEVSAALGEGTPAGRASMAVLTAAGVAWAWSLYDLGREGGGVRTGETQGVDRLFADRWAGVGLVLLAGLAWITVAAPVLAPRGDNPVFRFPSHLAPSTLHPMGTDRLGRDVMHRFLEGARATLGVGFGAGLAGALVGVLVGAVAGFRGGWIDQASMRVTDFFIAFPKLVLLIALVAVVDPSPLVLAFFIALTQWPGLARIVRGEVAALRHRDFVHALRALGYRERRILFLHVLPNVQGPVLVGVALSVANALLIEAGLGFLGIGMGGETYGASWGLLVREGATLFPRWWVGGFAGLALVVSVVALHFVADALSDALDPRADVVV